MIQWVYEAALSSGIGNEVIVATPDEVIAQACVGFDAKAVMTRSDHPSGTDRLAEVAEKLAYDIFVNVQGDEPLIRPETIAACAAPLLSDRGVEMGSVFADCPPEEVDQTSVVKVVTDLNSDAIYFSRHAIPFPRNSRLSPVKKHIGIYAFRRDLLLQFSSWKPTELEMTEGLEQLRFLEHGVRIKMSRGQGSLLAVDTPEQADEVRTMLASQFPFPRDE